MHTLELQKSVATAVQYSSNVLAVAAMFGLGIDESKTLELVPSTTLALAPGDLIFITGPSGSGKSTLLKLIVEKLENKIPIIDFANLPELPNAALVDLFDLPLDQTLQLLSRAGLNDAFVMLRTPAELSDGQRYRLKLAQAMAMTQPFSESVILADEFGASLDRITAKVIARNVRKWTSRHAVTFIAATTHDDLLEHLQPDCVIEQQLGGTLHIARREETPTC